jgi:FHS family L-fucose permease-like MFS transporter
MLVPLSADSKDAKDSSPSLVPKGLALPFSLVTALFFLWGVPNNLNDVLIRQFMKSFDISRFQAGLVQSAFYMGYFLLAIPAALLMRKRGYKFGIVIGLLLYASGAFLFWPAALLGRYGFFLFALFVIASGLSFLETASNPFVAQLGSPESAARRLNFSQAFNPLGSIAGVLLGTVFIFSGIELTPQQVEAMRIAHTYDAYLTRETMRVVVPYLVVGLVALIWAVLIARTKFPTIAREHENPQEEHGSFKELLLYPSFLFAIVAQFLYVGAQVGTWSYFIPYAQEYTHVSERIAGLLLTGTLVAFGIGRFGSAYIMQWLAPAKLMRVYAILNLLLLSVGIFAPGWYGLLAVLMTSFFMSIMYPTIFAIGIRDMGEETNLAGSLIVMAILGGAILTPVMGLISEYSHSMATAYLVPAVCYLVIAAFSSQVPTPEITA